MSMKMVFFCIGDIFSVDIDIMDKFADYVFQCHCCVFSSNLMLLFFNLYTSAMPPPFFGPALFCVRMS